MVHERFSLRFRPSRGATVLQRHDPESPATDGRARGQTRGQAASPGFTDPILSHGALALAAALSLVTSPAELQFAPARSRSMSSSSMTRRYDERAPAPFM